MINVFKVEVGAGFEPAVITELQSVAFDHSTIPPVCLPRRYGEGLRVNHNLKSNTMKNTYLN